MVSYNQQVFKSSSRGKNGKKIFPHFWTSGIIRVNAVIWGDQNKEGKRNIKSVFKIKRSRPYWTWTLIVVVDDDDDDDDDHVESFFLSPTFFYLVIVGVVV